MDLSSAASGFLGIEIAAPRLKIQHIALSEFFRERGPLQNGDVAVLTDQDDLIALKSVYGQSFHQLPLSMDGLPAVTFKVFPSDVTITVLSASVR